MTVRYYGRNIDESGYQGMMGASIRAFDRVRRMAERAAEVLVTLQEAHLRRQNLAVVAIRLLEEGVTEPGMPGARTPIQDVVDFQLDTPGVRGGRVRSRLHGLRRDLPLGLERDPGVSLDPSFNLSRVHRRETQPRSTRYITAPLVREVFQPLTSE